MKVFHGYQDIQNGLSNTVLTIGNFDGVHLGHRQIIQAVTEKAAQKKGTSVVYTFRPHPQQALSAQSDIHLINSYDEKLRLLEKLGVDVVVEEPFTREFSAIVAEKFFREILVKKMGVDTIFVGYDFSFGKDRAGGLELLKRLCNEEGVSYELFEPLRVDGQICSSSQIRRYLWNGEVEKANALLGREFFYSGIIVKGNGRGKKIGFATANIHTNNLMWLKEGVYATVAELRGKAYPSVTNIGKRPTFHSEESSPVVMETHLLDFDEDIYGESLKVWFSARLRDEKKFQSVDELTAQIHLDVERAKKLITQKSK